MSERLEFTGERFTPECEREIWYEHMHRYAFATRFCKGARVLDAACGEGYGAQILANTASHVTGIDISEHAVQHAQKRYSKLENLEFVTADCTKLPFEADQFDVVVSFETLEHLSEHELMLAEFRRVLQPGGFLILSSPDKAEYSEKRGYSNEFHTRELYRDELEQLISREFPAFRLLGQKLMFHSAIWDMDEIEKTSIQTVSEQGQLQTGRISHAPMYYIAFCAASAACLPQVGGTLDLFDDGEESVYAHYQHEIRKNMEAGGLLAQRDAEVQSLKKKIGAARKSWWQRLIGRLFSGA